MTWPHYFLTFCFALAFSDHALSDDSRDSVIMPISVLESDKWQELEKKIQTHSEMAIRSCVALETSRKSKGSGVMISKSGLILTSAHLFSAGEREVEVRCFDGNKRTAKVWRIDHEMDIALLRFLSFEPLQKNVARLTVNPTPLENGSTLIATGFASGLDSPGSAPLRIGFGFADPDEGTIFTTCRITLGDSGGPLFDSEGNLRGIHRSMDGAGRFSIHVSLERILNRWPDLRDLV